MTKLPDEFADLQDLANIFAISDDVERDRVEASVSQQQKQDLVSRVWPRMDAINTWLDAHDDEKAHLLGRLAEAACEVQLEIGSA